ncbi:M20/M25/M40 family metallo-hydrolase [Streptomyces cucumeris]|uniref:M20/M25/M40 family metallo-hydrolase n=1 Tax=Streptomyces cucumeris TaxID=2962890 RepID=UPI003D7526EE
MTYRGTAPGTVLLLCHYDTVWPAGTLAEWPFAVEDGRASGPGVFDMKTGIVQAVWSVRLLRELALPHPSVRLLLTGDEEIGSPASRRHSERLSEDALAEVVPHIAALGSAERGTTVNMGLISGGTGRNVVAARASCGVDVRIADPAEMAPVPVRTAFTAGLLSALAADAGAA